MRSWTLCLVACLGFAACTVDAIDFSEKGCPCLGDYVCDVGSNRCVSKSGAPTPPDDVPPSPPASDAGGPFCATQRPAPTLCLDFDDPDKPFGDLKSDVYGGTIGTDSITAISPPSSFVAEVPPQTGDNGAGAAIKRDIPRPTSELRIEFDVLLESAPQLFDLVEIAAPTPYATSYDFRLQVREDRSLILETTPLEDGGTEYRGSQLAPKIPLNEWQHVRVKVTLDNSQSSVVTTMGTAVIGTSDLLMHGVTSTELRLELGIFYIGSTPSTPTGRARVRLDNVVVDVH